MNNKIINNVDWGETDITKDISNLDYNIISTIKSNKTLRDMLIKKIEEEIERHNYMNSVLYYDTMVNNDCYTFYDGVPADFEVSIFNYDRKSKHLSLTSENTLINTFSFVSIYNKSDLMLSCGKSKSKYFELIHIPRILKYNPQDSENTNVEYSISEFSNKKYISQYAYEQYLKNIENNLYTEFMTENIIGDLFYESSRIFITLPTIIHFDPENKKYEFAKFARLSDYSLFGIIQNDSGDEIEYPYYLKYYFNYISDEHPKNYYHYYNRKSNNLNGIDINNVLVAYYEVEEDVWVLNDSEDEEIDQNEENETKIDQNENEDNKTKIDQNEENEEDKTKIDQNEENEEDKENDKSKFTGTLDIIINIHENSDLITSGSAQIYGNLNENNNEIWINDNVNFNLNKINHQIQATHQIQITQNINKNMLITEDSTISDKLRGRADLGALSDLDTTCLDPSDLINGNLKIIKIEGIEQTNPQLINFSNNISLIIISSTESQIIGKLNVEIEQTQNFAIYSNKSFEFKSFPIQKSNYLGSKTNLEISSLGSENVKISHSISEKIKTSRSITITENIPKYKVSKNQYSFKEYEIDPTKYHKERRIINKIMFECYYSNKNENEIYTYVPPTEKTISINNNANDSRNKTMPIYGFTYKIAGGSNLNVKTLPGMYLKLIMDYYSANDLHNIALIKRLVPISKLRLWMKGNEYSSDDFYKHIYGKPFRIDDEFHLNDLRDFYEICYGFPYSPEIEDYIIDYFKNVEKKDLARIIKNNEQYEYTSKELEIFNTFLGFKTSDYSNIVFKSGRDINNIYIAAYANEYTDFKHKYKHCYKIFDFNDCNNVKTIEISSEINGITIYFKTKNLNKIDFYLNGLNDNLKNMCELLKNENEYKYYKLFIN